MTDFTSEERELAEWLYNNGGRYEDWCLLARELIKKQEEAFLDAINQARKIE